MSYANSLIVLAEIIAQVVETLEFSYQQQGSLGFHTWTIKFHQSMTLGSNHFEN